MGDSIARVVLRVPSETPILTWADVDWARARLTVYAPKSERYPGHEQRILPIVPKLMRLLQDAFDAAQEGRERVWGPKTPLAAPGIEPGTLGL